MSKIILLGLSFLLLIAIAVYVGMYSGKPQLYPIYEGIDTLPKDTKDLKEEKMQKKKKEKKNQIEEITKYNSDNLDVEYHDDLQKTGTNNIYSTTMGKAKVYDVSGKLVDVISNDVQGSIVYYQPGSYKYGATSYVPYYEDSVFLSRSANAIVNAPTYVTSNVGGGFCNKYSADPLKLEQQCNTINNETCAATTCCVLLGGQKCVAGGENGPIMKDNYSDFMIANKDFYYYQGKCYGNCPNAPQFPYPQLAEKVPYMPPPPDGVYPPM